MIPPHYDYKITWSKQGDFRDDEPMVIRAVRYEQRDTTYVFLGWGPGYAEVIATLRQIDVSRIERLPEDQQ